MTNQVHIVDGRVVFLYGQIPRLLARFASPTFSVQAPRELPVQQIVLESLDWTLLSSSYLNLVCYNYLEITNNNFLTGRTIVLSIMALRGGEIADKSEFMDRIMSIVLPQLEEHERSALAQLLRSDLNHFFELFSTLLPFEGQSPISMLSGYFENKQQTALNIKYVTGNQVLDGTDLFETFPSQTAYEAGRAYLNPKVIKQIPPGETHASFRNGIDKKLMECFTKFTKTRTNCIHGLIPLSILLELDEYWSYIKIMSVVEGDLFNVKLYHDRCVGIKIHQLLAQRVDTRLAVFYSSFMLVLPGVDDRLRELYRTRFLYMQDTKAINPIPEDPANALIYMVNDIRNKVSKRYGNVLSKSRHCVEGPLISVASERGIHHITDGKVSNTWFKIYPGVVYSLLNLPQADNLHDSRGGGEITGQSRAFIG